MVSIQEKKVEQSKIRVVHRTPKKLIPLKFEACYAAIPQRQESELRKFVVKKEVEEFKAATKKPKKKIQPWRPEHRQEN